MWNPSSSSPPHPSLGSWNIYIDSYVFAVHWVCRFIGRICLTWYNTLNDMIIVWYFVLMTSCVLGEGFLPSECGRGGGCGSRGKGKRRSLIGIRRAFVAAVGSRRAATVFHQVVLLFDGVSDGGGRRWRCVVGADVSGRVKVIGRIELIQRRCRRASRSQKVHSGEDGVIRPQEAVGEESGRSAVTESGREVAGLQREEWGGAASGRGGAVGG